MAEIYKFAQRSKRHRRVRKKIVGTAERPRLAVYRSNRQIYAQLIDDTAGRTLAAATSLKNGNGSDPRARAKAVGQEIAAQAKKAGISTAIFDRGGFKYHGRVQAVAEGAREGGLEL
jgi:large subunit ribosomal protein L18